MKKIILETPYNTVATEFEPTKPKSKNRQSEAELEKEFIDTLCEQGYEYLEIKNENELIANLRTQLQKLNKCTFTDNEWDKLYSNWIANPNDTIIDKTKKIQEDHIYPLKFDDGSKKNFYLIDKTDISNNKLQVINQYTVGKKDGAKCNNRYDVTILVNGLPLVHIELKSRGNTILEAFNQIERYQRESFWARSGLYNYVQIFVISNGTNTKYYSNSTRFNAIKNSQTGKSKKLSKTSNSFEFTSFWTTTKNVIIPDLIDFTKTFFSKNVILNILIKYCVFTTENTLMVMRPYQICATEKILNRILISKNYKQYGKKGKSGGYIWHTTGSGKTLTSFKTAILATQLGFISKVLFVVDRKDLDYQTMREFDRFAENSVNSNTNTQVLTSQLLKDDVKIIVTTIQKLNSFIKNNPKSDVYKKEVVIVFDECHRSQFGDMHQAITSRFEKYYLFGFTGTPIFPENVTTIKNPKFCTTEAIFGERLHTYTIINAISDNNVLPFKVDYIKTMDEKEDIRDEQVRGIKRETAIKNPKRIQLVTKYILEHFNQKTYRESPYTFKKIVNISDLVSSKKGVIEDKQEKPLKGFNSIFAVSSVDMAKLYYNEFKKQMKNLDDSKKLRIATIFSYKDNEETFEGLLDEEDSENTDNLDLTSKEFLSSAIQDYNDMFGTTYDISNRYSEYYKDVSLRMKNKELDILIVVNMFLTGFDSTTLNTLWVDKNLRMHGLIQAFSRTNRILNSVKKFGNIICFSNLSENVDEAIKLFADESAGGIILIRTFKEYYEGYTGEDGKLRVGYKDMIKKLQENFPLGEQMISEKKQKDFISLFGSILRMINLLNSFDEFKGKEIISERDLQDYLGLYQDLKDVWKRKRDEGELVDIQDDIVFEIELIKQIEINIDYILGLIQDYKNEKDNKIIETIMRAIKASPELRSKKSLISDFIDSLNNSDSITKDWNEYVLKQREEDLKKLINDEKLKNSETRKFLTNSFKSGEMKTFGTSINDLMPTMSRFENDREIAKERIINKLKEFFEKYFGIGGTNNFEEQDNTNYDAELDISDYLAAETEKKE